MKNSILIVAVVIISLLNSCVLNPSSTTKTRGEIPENAIQYIAKSFDKFPIVCIGEFHGSKNQHDFFTRMLADTNVQNKIDIIIVEFVNASYQAVLDDYIFGKDVTYQELCKTWQNTCISPLTTWDAPLYYEFLKNIRNINEIRPDTMKLRIMGGDPPIQWEKINEMNDMWSVMSQRNSYPAQLAIEQAIEKKKKVLIIFGAGHLPKVPDIVRGKERKCITNIIQEKYPDKIKVISTVNTEDLGIEDKVSDLKIDCIYELQKHWLGEIKAERYFPTVFYSDGSGKATLYNGYLLKDIFDALIYIGPQSKWEIISAPKEVFDDEYFEELNRRSMILYNEPIDSTLRE